MKQKSNLNDIETIGKFQIVTPLSYNHLKWKGEVNSGEVVTVPDDSYTIQEILDKFTRGINIDHLVDEDVYYSDTEDFDEVDERTEINDFTDIETSLVKVRSREKSKQHKGSSGKDESEGKKGSSEADDHKPTDESKPAGA